jgi:ribosomal protein S18 acetylase RimI-like enzyme
MSPSADTLHLRQATPADGPAILRAFQRAFAAVDPGHRERRLAEWRWRFVDAPHGAHALIAIDRAGEVHAQYAGLVQRMRVDGRELTASQSIDSFADPGEASSLARSKSFVRVGESYAETFGGAAAGQDAWMWGLPVPAAWRLGRRTLGYELLRSLAWLEAEAIQAAPTHLRVEPLEGFEPAFDRLTAQAQRGRPIAAVRDRAWLEWRFLRHPSQRYELGVVREGSELAGFAAARVGSFDGRPGLLLVDWIAPSERADVHATLWRWLAQCAAQRGAVRVLALVPDTAPEWLAFQEAGFRARPSRYPMVARSYRRDLPLDDLRLGWWFTLADTDLA